MSVTDATIQKKQKKKNHHESGITTLIISNEEMEHIMKTVKSLRRIRITSTRN